MSLRGTKQSRPFVIARYVAISIISVIARDEAISVSQGWQTEKREIAALRSQPPEGALTENLVIARYVAISVFQGGQEEKREIAALRSQPPEGALTRQRNVAISVFHNRQTEKREIAALRSQ